MKVLIGMSRRGIAGSPFLRGQLNVAAHLLIQAVGTPQEVAVQFAAPFVNIPPGHIVQQSVIVVAQGPDGLSGHRVAPAGGYRRQQFQRRVQTPPLKGGGRLAESVRQV